jgi:Right handed beta helix region
MGAALLRATPAILSLLVTGIAPLPQSTSRCGATGSGVCRYVDAAKGNDANPGTRTLPFRTLQQAADVANPADDVIVNDGVYTGGSTVLTVGRSGTAGNWIVFRAAHPWGAVVDGRNNRSAYGIRIRGNYIRVEGFDVRGLSNSGIDAFAGNELVAVTHDVAIVGNQIHDIGRICDDGSGGRGGIAAYVSNLVIEQNVIHDIGRLGPGEQGCNPTTTNWQNHDHGIYHAVGDSVVIRNNLFYRNQRGWSYHRYSGAGATARGVYILNNTFVSPNPNRDGQIVIAGATAGLVIANNIFYQPTTAGIRWGRGGSWAGALVETNLSTALVATPSVSGVTFVGNVERTDPKVVDPVNLDFHLQSGSPAIQVGVALVLVTNDLHGKPRPHGARYDIGAYQFK